MKDSRSPGPDRILAKILKDAAELICNPLKIIFNKSLKTGVFPDKWKTARETPIFKSGRHSDLNNYRPIPVLSAVSRIFEKVTRDQLFEFLTANNLLSKNQFAYRKLHSTVTSLLNVIDSWYSNIDRKNVNISLFLDLRKAFDTIDHNILLAKLQKYGICQKELAWFASYLTERQQYCYLNGQNSEKRLVTCGIPQGSCLGPLLFILYTNDFEESLTKFAPNMYANDTSISLGGEDAYQLLADLRNELQHIMDSLRQNKLSLNVAKCEDMFIGNSKQLGKISEIGDLKVGEDEIKRVRKTKYLGLTIDENLSWNQQYKIVKGKLKGGLNSISKLKHMLLQSKLFQVYRALVESHLRYGNLLWGHLSVTKPHNLQKLQDRAITLI